MKTILVPLIDTVDSGSPLAAAALVAREFGSSVEGFCFKALSPATAYLEAAAGMLDEELEHSYRERASVLRQMFFDRLAARGIPKTTARSKPGQSGARWVDDVEGGHPYVTNRTRLFDLAIVARGTAAQNHYARAAVEARHRSIRPQALPGQGGEPGRVTELRSAVKLFRGNLGISAHCRARPILRHCANPTCTLEQSRFSQRWLG